MRNVEIKLFTSPDAKPITRRVESGTTVESLVREYRSHLPYRIMAVRINGDSVRLSETIEKQCEIVFCDLRENVGNRAFQGGLVLVFLKAVEDLFGGARVVVKNSINRGLYMTIDTPAPITEDQLRQVERRMWEIVDANLPITMTKFKKGNLFDYLKERGASKQIDWLKHAPNVRYLNVYDLDGYDNYFYGNLPPSSNYAEPFALKLFHDGVLMQLPSPQHPDRVEKHETDDKIFAAFEEESVIMKAFGIGYIGDLDEVIERDGGSSIIHVIEERHRRAIEGLSRTIAESGKRIILIAGPSSSGKTTFTKRLIEQLEGRGKKALYLGTDDYFFDRNEAPKDRKGRYNYEGLDALDVELFEKNMKALLSGKKADIPRYDFIDGKKKFGERIEKLGKNEVVFIEGIHALNDKLSEEIPEEEKFRIYISPLTQLNIDDHNRVSPTDVRLIRRICRDSRTRGTSAKDTLSGWKKVSDGEVVNIFPFNNKADAVFNSAIAYELCVLRNYAEPLLEEVKPGDPNHGHANWLLYLLRFFSPITDESPISEESLLREFIGGSKY
jgi:uridine kinase